MSATIGVGDRIVAKNPAPVAHNFFCSTQNSGEHNPNIPAGYTYLGQFIDHAKEILESVKKNNHVRGKVAERGRVLLDLYRLMVLPFTSSSK